MTQSNPRTVPVSEAPDPVPVLWEATQEFRFTFIGEAAGRAFGYPPRRWLDDPEFWSAILDPDDRERVVAAMCAAARTPGDHRVDYRIHRRRRSYARDPQRVSRGRSSRWVETAVGSDGQRHRPLGRPPA